MLSVPGGGGGGGRGEGGGAINQGDSLQGVRKERGGEGLTQHFLSDNTNLAATAVAATTAIIPETSLGNNKPSLLKLPAVMASPPSRPLIAPSLSPTTPSFSASQKNMVKPCSDHNGMATTPPPPCSSSATGLLPFSMTSAAAQVKLTLAESHRMTPVTPHPLLPLSGSSNSSSSMANDTASKHDDDDEEDVTRAEKVDNDDNSDDNNDDDVNNNNNNNNVIYHPGISSLDVLAVTTTMTTTKAMDVVETQEKSSGGGPVRNLRVRGQRKFLPEKTRHKRQTLQDMTRPLKQWLIRHKDNPYPSKAQKMDLVSKSHMTLTQVSNWFANARRRLKNTVKQPDLSWACRIKLYNSCVEGNAELFSLGSDDDSCLDSDDDMMEHRQSDTFHDDVTDSMTSSRTATPDVTGGSGEACSSFNHGSNSGNHHSNNNNHHDHHHSHQLSHSSSSSNSGPSCSGPSGPQPCPGLEDSCSSFPKYKHSILHRYLSDSHHQALILDEDSVAKSRDRHHSSSTGSRDFEELSTSSVSSPAHESLHHDHLDDFSEEFETMALRRRTSDVSSSSTAREEDMYWKEIGAALALTSLAKGRGVRI